MNSMLDRRRVLAAAGGALVLGLAKGAVAAPGTPDTASVITVPIQLRRQRLLLPLWIDGKGPFQFILDTGAPFYAIDEQVARNAGLKTMQSTYTAGMTGLARRVDDFYGSEVVIGGALKSENVVFTASRFNEGEVVGLAPLQLLLLRRTDLDPAAGQIRIYETGGPDLTGFQRLPLWKGKAWINGAVVGDSGARGPKLTIDISWDGRPYRVWVDTGAPSALTIFATAVRRHGLWDKYPRWAQADGRGMYEPFKARIVRGQSLAVGSVTMKDPVVHLIGPDEPDTAREVDGVIGLDTLRRLSMSIDNGDNALWVKANGAVDQPFRYNRSGIQLGQVNGRMGVAAVAPGSPAAAAGLQPGDVILTPNGRSGADFQWSLFDAPGTVIEFAVRRDGAVKPIRLVLAELL
jgi:predicted aspartyl protease